MAETIFDSVRFETVTAGDKDFQRELVEEFERSSGSCLRVIADNGVPHATWTAAAHRLKGAASNMGGVQLAKLCEAAQHAAPDVDKVAAHAKMANAYEALHAKLLAYCRLT